jgi:hypothetical protein
MRNLHRAKGRSWSSLRRVVLLPEFIFGVCAFSLVSLNLMLHPMLGIADQGDFLRVTGVFGIHYLSGSQTANFENYFVRFMGFGGSHYSAYPSSTVPLIAVAAAVSKAIYGNLFDVSIMGWIYTALYAAGVSLVVRGVRRAFSRATAIVCGFLGLFVTADLAYTAYFNSLYSEPTSFVFMILSMGAALNVASSHKPNYPMIGLTAVFFAGFLTSKEQMLPLLPVALILLARLALSHRGFRWRAVVGTLAAALVGVSAYSYALMPKSFDKINVYESVFYGVLYHQSAASVKSDLEWFGVDPKYAKLANTTWWTPNNPYDIQSNQFAQDFFSRVGHAQVVEFYLTHPRRLLDAVSESSAAAASMRPEYLGNFREGAGQAPKAISYRLSLWSTLKSEIFPRSFWFLAAFYVLYFANVMVSWIRNRGMRNRYALDVLIAFGLFSVLQFVIPYTAEGANELVKHMYAFNSLLDGTFVTAAVWGIRQIFMGHPEEDIYPEELIHKKQVTAVVVSHKAEVSAPFQNVD